MPEPTRMTVMCALLFAGSTMVLSNPALAQHAGDIGLTSSDGQLEVYGPLGSNEDTQGVFLGTFGDTGFAGYTPNPGFDAAPGTFSGGRIGFDAMSGLMRWDPTTASWLEPEQVGERLRITFITLETIIQDRPISGFDLAVQPDGGWHRHMNYELLPDQAGSRLAGVYRFDVVLYSTQGLEDSEPFTLVFDYEADQEDVDAAIQSMYDTNTCPGDFDGNGFVDGADLTRLLSEWGLSDTSVDLSGDGVISGADLTILLGRWGICGM